MGRRRVLWAHAAEAALVAVLVAAPMLLGGAPPWAQWPICALALASLAFASFGAAAQHQRLRLPIAAAIPGGVALLCAVQLVPLPHALLKLLSPEAAELGEIALQPLGLTQWRPVTLDPPATLRELCKHLSYAAVLVASVEVARSRRARTRLLAAVALCGGLIAALGLGHKAANLQSVFGLYSFKSAAPPIVTPFGNPNHLAAFLTLTGAVTLGFAVRPSARRPAWALSFAAQALVVFLSLSRGGAIFFVAAQALFGCMLLLKDRAQRAMYAAAASLVGLAFAGGVAMDQLWNEFGSTSSKTDLWPMFARGASGYWLLGMGRGAFEAAFPRYQTQLGGYVFTHPENAVLQLCSELGVPAAAALFALGALVLRRALSRHELWSPELAAVCGLIALGAHELFDFSLELPATAVAAALLVGIIARAPDASEEPAPINDLRLSGRHAAWASTALFAVGLVALSLGGSTLPSSEVKLRSALAGAAKDQIASAVAAAVDEHPAYSALPAIAAQAYARLRAPQEALASVNRALLLRPLDGPSHRIAARALLELGKRGQAFLEYRLAVSAGDFAALREALPRARSVDELDRLCPDDRFAVEDAITQTWLAGRQEHALGLAEAVADRWEGKPEAAILWARMVELHLARSDLPSAQDALAALEEVEPQSARHAMARARVLAASGDAQGGVEVLLAYTAQEPGDVQAAMLLVEQLLAANQTRAARDALDRLSPFIATPSERAQLMYAQGRAFEKEERFAKALESYQTASRLQPDSAGLHYAVGRMHEHHGQPGAAARAVLEGVRVDNPAGAAAMREWADRLAEQERKLVVESAKPERKTGAQLLQDKLLEVDPEPEPEK